MSTSITTVKNNNCWDAFLFHLNRIRMWRLREATVTEKEAEGFLEAKVSNHLMQKYMAWRRSLLMFSLPSIFISSVFDLVVLAKVEGWEYYSPLGKLSLLMDFISPAVFFVALCFSTYHWRNVVKSTNICAYGWLFSLLAPIWPALFPVKFLANDEWFQVMQEVRSNDPENGDPVWGVKFVLGVGYSLKILPLVLTIPVGALKGSLRVRGLLPECSLAGWFIVVIAPITPLMIFASVVFMLQMFGDETLLTGVVLLMISPMLYVFRRRLYTEALTEEQDRSLDWNQRIMTILSITGVVMIGVWAYDADFLPEVTDVFRFLFQWVGRALTTTLFFVDTVFRMTIHQLQVDRKRLDDGHYAEVDMLLASLPTNFDEDEQNSEEVKNSPTSDTSDSDDVEAKEVNNSTSVVEP